MDKFEIATVNGTATFLQEYPHLTDAISSGAILLVESSVALVAYEIRPLTSTLILHGAVELVQRSSVDGAAEFLKQEAKTWGCKHIAVCTLLAI